MLPEEPLKQIVFLAIIGGYVFYLGRLWERYWGKHNSPDTRSPTPRAPVQTEQDGDSISSLELFGTTLHPKYSNGDDYPRPNRSVGG